MGQFLKLSTLLALTRTMSVATADSLASIDHVILFMQENRAFDHYFGTMAGIRGFSDPNVQVNPNGKSVWYQDLNSELSNSSDYLLPWYLNYLGGTWDDATMCMVAGDNGWDDNHAALHGGLNDHWATNNTPWSWAYYKRADIPIQYAYADGWTIGDMYQESVIASTNPNRVTWTSGSINVPGSPQNPDEGGVYIDNYETPGCEAPGLSCYPLKWETTPEIYQAAGVSWQIYQDIDNFDDNPLAWFEQYQDAANGTALASRGMSYLGLDTFYEAAANGTLPMISYIVGPTELSEHPPYSPRDGAWLQQQVVNAVTTGKNWNTSALIISYDETGGWGDHVTPYHSPEGTPGEWLEDPEGIFGYTYSGPGFRLPFYIISPWTRGGNVFTERSDHNSQIMFVEKWLEAKGYKNVVTSQMPAWRRTHMSDLVSAFDFSKHDPSIPSDIPIASVPHSTNGTWDGSSYCEALYPIQRPPVPYGQQTESNSLISESGFKPVRGSLTEGRYLTFEMNGFALTNPGRSSAMTATKATASHNTESQLWVIHEVGTDQVFIENTFTLSSKLDGTYLGGVDGTSFENKAAAAVIWDIEYLGGGVGYSLQDQKSGLFLSIGPDGHVLLSREVGKGFSVYSVT